MDIFYDKDEIRCNSYHWEHSRATVRARKRVAMVQETSHYNTL